LWTAEAIPARRSSAGERTVAVTGATTADRLCPADVHRLLGDAAGYHNYHRG
jgi:hypothetical protein